MRGADRGRVQLMILRERGALFAIGFAIGIATAQAVSGVMQGLL